MKSVLSSSKNQKIKLPEGSSPQIKTTIMKMRKTKTIIETTYRNITSHMVSNKRILRRLKKKVDLLKLLRLMVVQLTILINSL